MTKRKIPLALIYGGMGCEREISVKSAEGLYRALKKAGGRIFPTFISPLGEWFLAKDEETSPQALAKDPEALADKVYPKRIGKDGGFSTDREFIKIGAAIPILHGDFGEDGRIQGALDTVGIPYVGCSVETSAVCRNKSILKSILKSHGIPMLDWVLVSSSESIDAAIARAEATLGYPMFVKPTSLGSSIGAGPARERSELRQRLESARAVSDSVMIERCLSGKRELECAFFEYKGKRYFTNPGEIRYNSEFYDYESKYVLRDTEIKAVADVGQEIRDRIRDVSAMIADVVGLRHLARIDFFLSSTGEVYFNEINTIPGLTSASLFPLMAKGAGVDLGELFLGLSRAAQTK